MRGLRIRGRDRLIRAETYYSVLPASEFIFINIYNLSTINTGSPNNEPFRSQTRFVGVNEGQAEGLVVVHEAVVSHLFRGFARAAWALLALVLNSLCHFGAFVCLRF